MGFTSALSGVAVGLSVNSASDMGGVKVAAVAAAVAALVPAIFWLRDLASERPDARGVRYAGRLLLAIALATSTLAALPDVTRTAALYLTLIAAAATISAVLITIDRHEALLNLLTAAFVGLATYMFADGLVDLSRGDVLDSVTDIALALCLIALIVELARQSVEPSPKLVAGIIAASGLTGALSGMKWLFRGDVLRGTVLATSGVFFIAIGVMYLLKRDAAFRALVIFGGVAPIGLGAVVAFRGEMTAGLVVIGCGVVSAAVTAVVALKMKNPFIAMAVAGAGGFVCLAVAGLSSGMILFGAAAAAAASALLGFLAVWLVKPGAGQRLRAWLTEAADRPTEAAEVSKLDRSREH